jgi:hypothetical protein
MLHRDFHVVGIELVLFVSLAFQLVLRRVSVS